MVVPLSMAEFMKIGPNPCRIQGGLHPIWNQAWAEKGRGLRMGGLRHP